MNFLDALIIAPLLWGAYKGFQKGLIYEIAMIMGLIIGVYLGFKFSGLVFKLLQEILPDEGQLLNYLSFFIVFGAILLIFIFYAKLMEAVLKIASLNLFNKVAGSIFGLLKFALAISVIFWLIKPMQQSLNIIPEKSRKESMLYEPVLKIASSLSPAVKDVKDEFRENFGNR
ncbi:MAG: CvpA family protein [Bacteroidota bacterium]|nr:CvpA family protein [Bacteroidota bacterium]